MITLYSTGCPKCNVLMKKLDVNELLAKGYDEVPLLEVEAKLLKFTEAVNWINEQVKGTN